MSERWKHEPEGATWGEFGPDDRLGRLNLITREKLLQGIAEVKEGLSFCLSLLCVMGVVLTHASTARAASADASASSDYPSRPVRIIVPAAAGGTADILARIYAPKLSEIWRQQILIDNRPGAGTVVGTEIGAKAAPDGYTLFQPAAAHSINPALFRKLPYDTLKAFEPITLLAEVPNVLVVTASLPVNSVKELIALAKDRSGQLQYASSGVGNATHLAGELFKDMTRTNFVHVPYRSGAPAMIDVVAGHVPMYFSVLPTALPHIQSGKVRALGVTGSRRSSVLPNVPTIAEAGVAGFEVTSWYGLLAPAGTSRAIINEVHARVVKVLGAPDVRTRIKDVGADAVGNSPGDFGSYIERDIEKWRRVIVKAGVKPE